MHTLLLVTQLATLTGLVAFTTLGAPAPTAASTLRAPLRSPTTRLVQVTVRVGGTCAHTTTALRPKSRLVLP